MPISQESSPRPSNGTRMKNPRSQRIIGAQEAAFLVDRPSSKGDSGSFLYIFRTTSHRCPQKRIRGNGRSIHTYQPHGSTTLFASRSNCNWGRGGREQMTGYWGQERNGVHSYKV